MQTILILGGFGFIASNVLAYIDSYLSTKYRVVVFDKFPTHHHGLTFDCVEKVYSGDFSDKTIIEQIFTENKIDIVFHLLSSTVPATAQNPVYDVESNLIATLNLLEVMREHDVKNIMYISSGGAIYGDKFQKVHNEDDSVYPKSSYGVVKLTIEKYLFAYSELYGFNSLILRLSNPYGKYHYNERQGVVNIAIRKALRGEKLSIWGNGNGLKDYIFVDDVCDLLFKLVATGMHTDVYNVAAGSAHSVNEIAEIIQKEIPDFSFEHTQASLTDVESFELDITKLRKRLGGYRFTSFEEGIRKTIEWEKK